MSTDQPQSITLIWRTDVHLADQPPQSRTDDWTATLLDKIRQVGKIAKHLKATAVIDGGDFFHVKSPTRNSHQLVQQAIEAHREYPCPVYACIGNHDCKYGDYAYLDEQPLGVMFQSKVFRRLYDEHEAIFEIGDFVGMGGTQMVGLSSGYENKMTVRVVGVPYHGTTYDMARLASIKKGSEDYLVVVAHMLASKAGGSMFEGEDIVKYADLAGLDPDCWMFGHWHKDQGVTEIAPGKHVINIGSLSRGALSQDELVRIPKVAILTFTRSGLTIDEQPLEVRPPAEVFDLDRRKRAETRTQTIETFVDSIQETLGEVVGETDLADIIRQMPNVSEPVKEQALLYWEQARLG